MARKLFAKWRPDIPGVDDSYEYIKPGDPLYSTLEEQTRNNKAMKITHHNWSPDFSNKVEIESGDSRDMFTIEITQDSPDIEINFDWDHGWGGRGNARMTITIDTLMECIMKTAIPIPGRIKPPKEEFRDKNGQTFDQWADDNGCY